MEGLQEDWRAVGVGEPIGSSARTCCRPSRVVGASSSRGTTSTTVDRPGGLNGVLGHEAVAGRLKLALFAVGMTGDGEELKMLHWRMLGRGLAPLKVDNLL